MKRRLFLKMGSIGLFSTFSGCILQNNSKKMRLGLVDIVNTHDEPHTVELIIKKDGETVHKKRHKLKAMTEKEKDGVMVDVPGEKVLDRWGEEKARYFFKAKLEGQDKWKTFQLGESGFGGEECSTVIVRIDYSGKLIFGESDCRKPN